MNAPLEPHALAAIDELPVPKGFELIGGVLVEKPVGMRSSRVGARLLALLDNHCEQHDLGHIFGADAGYRCFAQTRLVRKPDVSFIRRGRLPDEHVPDGDLRMPPDLAVEVISANDKAIELNRKVEDYLGAGVRLVWVIDPENRLVVVHRLNLSMARVGEDQELTGEDVVPGFSARPASFLLPPAPPVAE